MALFFAVSLVSVCVNAQDTEEEETKKGFKKENLFTGGSISLAFYNNTFLVGGSPVLGYSITNWADLGIVVNYNYTSYRDYNYIFNDKLKQYVYGGGAFIKLYPVRFLFAQAQYEYNFIKQKYIPGSGTGTTQEYKAEAGSFTQPGVMAVEVTHFFTWLSYLIFQTMPTLPIQMVMEERSRSSEAVFKSHYSRAVEEETNL
jgi:hypothetical protein